MFVPSKIYSNLSQKILLLRIIFCATEKSEDLNQRMHRHNTDDTPVQGIISKDLVALTISSRNMPSEEKQSLRLIGDKRRLQTMPSITMPIFQGYGSYYIDIFVGSPPQRQTVLIDTGSNKIAIPCHGCTDCGEYHIDPLYNQFASDSFSQLKCSECKQGKCNKDNTCSVSSHYEEGSSWEGREVTDKIYPGEIAEERLSSDNSGVVRFDNMGMPLTFTCMESSKAEFHDQMADGIVGLGMVEGSLWKQMYDQGIIQSKQFSLCLSSHPIQTRSVGALTLGGIDDRLGQKESDMAYMEMNSSSGFYEVRIRKIFLHKDGGERIQDFKLDSDSTIMLDVDEKTLNHKSVVLDSGTTGTLLTPVPKDALDSAWVEATGLKFPTDDVTITSKDLKHWPTIVFQMKGSLSNSSRMHSPGDLCAGKDHPCDVLVALPPSHYMTLDLLTGKYRPLLRTDGAYSSDNSILGSNFMRHHNVLFDIDNEQIGFAESDCNFNHILFPKGKQDQMTVPDPYASYSEVISWYKKDVCANQKGLCTDLTLLRIVNISGILILIIFIGIMKFDNKRLQKKKNNDDANEQIQERLIEV